MAQLQTELQTFRAVAISRTAGHYYDNFFNSVIFRAGKRTRMICVSIVNPLSLDRLIGGCCRRHNRYWTQHTYVLRHRRQRGCTLPS